MLLTERFITARRVVTQQFLYQGQHWTTNDFTYERKGQMGRGKHIQTDRHMESLRTDTQTDRRTDKEGRTEDGPEEASSGFFVGHLRFDCMWLIASSGQRAPVGRRLVVIGRRRSIVVNQFSALYIIPKRSICSGSLPRIIERRLGTE